MAATIYRPPRVISDYPDEPGGWRSKQQQVATDSTIQSAPVIWTLDLSTRKCYTCNWRYFHQILSFYDLPAWSYGPKWDGTDRPTDGHQKIRPP